ncbi:MAG: DeoR/GlpR family DNA-binding transcription regulator [Eubacteriaceae bacterium]
MLTEERFERILQLLEEKRSATVQELSEYLESSESTIRRDLTVLNNEGKLNKVHGGATAIPGIFDLVDSDLNLREDHFREEKKIIGEAGAKLIEKNDFVFIDGGTSTEALATAIAEKSGVYVTNGLNIARKLLQKGLKTIILGGEIKPVTQAVVGIEALNSLEKYHFTKGFFGTNGIEVKAGFTTPEHAESLVKIEALKRCKEVYVLADPSKFGQISPVTFGDIGEASIITTKLKDKKYKKYTKILEVKEK